MSFTRTAVIGLLLTVVAPAPSRADGLIVPFFSVNFGGDSGSEPLDAVDASRFNWGASFAWMGGGIFGVEGDVGYSPDFFGSTDAGGSSVFTATGNLLVGVPFGGQSGFGLRPYGVVGIGLVRPDGDAFGGDELFGENRLAWDFGGGLMLFFSTHTGIRADIRYFRTFEATDLLDVEVTDDLGHLDFTRGSLGFVLRF
jgi:hypothetical protein